jgi:hypothetical protein
MVNADGPVYVLGSSAGAGAVRDRLGQVVAFPDPHMAQAVGAYLAASGPPILAPIALDDPTGCRVVASDEAALAVCCELLDDHARLRRKIATIAARC